jgi:arylsulfatase A-like enzyme
MGLSRLIVRFVSAALVAAAAVALLDALVAVGGARVSLGLGPTLRLVASLVVLAVLPAVLLGLLEGVLLGGVSGAGLWSWLGGLRADAARDRHAASWMWAALVAAGLFAGALAWLSPRLFTLPEEIPARAEMLALRGLILAGLAVLLLGGLALVAWTLARALQVALCHFPEGFRGRCPWTWLTLGLGILGLLGTALAVTLPRAELLNAFDGELLLWALLFFGAQGALLWFWRRPLWPSGRRKRLAAFLLAGALVGASATVVLTFDEPALLSLTFQRTVVGKRMVSLWRQVLDFDRDGYSALLGGGDCDDGDPRVHPGAVDVPGNGIDEDCSGADARLPEEKKATAVARRTGTNFLLLTVDTVRADHVGAYGYARATTPNLDAFARTAVVFEWAFSASNHTPRSIPALVTGLYPSRLTWKKVTNYPALADNVRTVAEDLRAAGYRTVGVFPHWYFHKRRNLHRGFDVWDLSVAPPQDDGSAVTAPELTRRARQHLRELAQGPAPFFLWVHYQEPHYPYVEHEGSPRFGRTMMDRYDGEIRFVDTHVGQLLGELEATGVAPQTAVFVTSDHGEAFGEHGKHWHGHALYNEQVRVPFLLRAPGIAAGRIRSPVSAVDVVPTMLDLAGLPIRAGLSGRSLVAVARGTTEHARPVLVELLAYPNFPRSMRAVVVGDLKLIHDHTENRFELFDLARDSGEKDDLFGERPSEAERLKAILVRFADGGPLALLGP